MVNKADGSRFDEYELKEYAPVEVNRITEWKTKSAQCPQDIAWRIVCLPIVTALIVGLYHLSCHVTPYSTHRYRVPEILTAFFSIYKIIPLAKKWIFVLSCFVNYHNRGTAEKAVRGIKRSEHPINLDTFRLMAKYGIVTDEEYEKREKLESSITDWQLWRRSLDGQYALHGERDQKRQKILKKIKDFNMSIVNIFDGEGSSD